MYYFKSDKMIAHVDPSVDGFWGTPDSELNWCEADYQWSRFCAEPINTSSGAVLILVPLVGFLAHRDIVETEPRFRLSFLLLGLLGVGTVLFHATLRYKLQLADELPLFWLLLSGVYCSVTRSSKHLDTKLFFVFMLAAVGMAGVLLFTPRSAVIHNIGRGVLACLFAGLLLYQLYSLSKIGHETDRMMEIKGRNNGSTGSALLSQSIYLFVAAVICWIFDNGFCSVLRRLPVYIPLHAVWHLLSMALYDWAVLMMFHRCLFHGRLVELRMNGSLAHIKLA